MKMNKEVYLLQFNKMILAFSIFFSLAIAAQAQSESAKELQERMLNTIRNVQAASVFIESYDTLSKQSTGSRFSGVLVSEDGTILTAAHVGIPNQSYLVMLNDGSTHVAMGLGAIPKHDAAVLKMKDPGKWAFAEMGWSSSLKINDPCISIAYPASFIPMRSVIRFGYVKDVFNTTKGMLQTSCLMEPGDSGGPVFDIYGRVVGIHSRIDLALDRNFEVPIDVFKKYWSALQQPVTYTNLPIAEKQVAADPIIKKKWDEKKYEQVQQYLVKYEAAFDKFTIRLWDPADSTKKAIGTLVALNKFGIKEEKNTSYIITKASLLEPTMRAMLGKEVKPFVEIYRDDKKDLALLKVSIKSKDKLVIAEDNKESFDKSSLGKILISPNPENEGEISVLGSTIFNLTRTSVLGYLGTVLEVKDGHNVVADVQQNSPATMAGLIIGDEVLKVGVDTVAHPSMWPKLIAAYQPGDAVLLSIKRKEAFMKLTAKLGLRPTYTSAHIAERFEDGKSKRFDGFNNAFIHDSKLKPSECGGPIFDLDGNFMGINMARYSRTSSVAATPFELATFIKEAVSSALLVR
ncbi:trypsin-like peptidase domain-containing protein [Niabella sp. CJ426]|uniref:trypsin-like peptidase domain-containing protein n=1 Tax=Niabella sp. CJ426 TaxID=3393740 RepID=UPI003D06F4C3